MEAFFRSDKLPPKWGLWRIRVSKFSFLFSGKLKIDSACGGKALKHEGKISVVISSLFMNGGGMIFQETFLMQET